MRNIISQEEMEWLCGISSGQTETCTSYLRILESLSGKKPSGRQSGPRSEKTKAGKSGRKAHKKLRINVSQNFLEQLFFLKCFGNYISRA